MQDSYRPLSAGNLTGLVADELSADPTIPQEAKLKQCEQLGVVWRSWSFSAARSLTPGNAQMVVLSRNLSRP